MSFAKSEAFYAILANDGSKKLVFARNVSNLRKELSNALVVALNLLTQIYEKND